MQHKIIVDPAHGFRRLEPLPSEAELAEFFKETYYRLVLAGKRGADLKRAIESGEPARRQERWFAETVHRDIADVISANAPGRRVLEVGCGLGELLHFLAMKGFSPEGIDVATAAVEAAQRRGLTVHEGTVEIVATGALENQKFDAVVFVSVLEQLREPEKVLKVAVSMLNPGGLLVVRSGNDFNPLQIAARDALGMPEWWVAIPDHTHYFSFESIASLFKSAGAPEIYRQADFPMELFLLMGYDYLNDPKVGNDCHQRRVDMELAIPTDLRRKIYEALAMAGVGRCIFMVGRKTAA